MRGKERFCARPATQPTRLPNKTNTTQTTISANQDTSTARLSPSPSREQTAPKHC
jgi:hypothetical protein